MERPCWTNCRELCHFSGFNRSTAASQCAYEVYSSIYRHLHPHTSWAKFFHSGISRGHFPLVLILPHGPKRDTAELEVTLSKTDGSTILDGIGVLLLSAEPT